MKLAPGTGEPLAGPWRSVSVTALAQALLDWAAESGVHRCVVAINGRSGSGKTTVAQRLEDALPAATLLSTDDIAWHESMFDWANIAVSEVLAPFRSGQEVHYRPPAWDRHSRPGHVGIPPTSRFLLLEGVGASQRALSDVLDVTIWVQSDFEVAEQRGIARDVASGVNGDETQSIAFWHSWIAQEIPFLERDRPWERADVIVAGTSRMKVETQAINVASPLTSKDRQTSTSLPKLSIP
jgi:uridine kinase